MTGICRLKILKCVHGTLAAYVHGLSYSNGQPKCGWMAACVKLHANTSDPLLSRIWWTSGLHGNSSLGWSISPSRLRWHEGDLLKKLPPQSFINPHHRSRGLSVPFFSLSHLARGLSTTPSCVSNGLAFVMEVGQNLLRLIFKEIEQCHFPFIT